MIARAFYTHEHELMLAADSKHLIALRCHYRRALVIYAGLVYVQLHEVCSLALGMLGKVAFERGFVYLVEHCIEVVVCFFNGVVLPLAFDADLLILGGVHAVHDLVDDRLREEPLGQPLMRHRGHSRLDICITKVFYKRNVRVDNKEIRAYEKCYHA